MQTGQADYYRARERAERKAAETAQCPQARRAHEEMANAYALMIEAGLNPQPKAAGSASSF
jgi:hypothetical protein